MLPLALCVVSQRFKMLEMSFHFQTELKKHLVKHVPREKSPCASIKIGETTRRVSHSHSNGSLSSVCYHSMP